MSSTCCLFSFLLSLSLLAQSNTYFGPNHPVPNQDELIRVQIVIQDSPQNGGVHIVSAAFDGQDIPLMPRDVHGNRGTGSFQVRPGKYKLRWTVNRNKRIWPRNMTHEDIVDVNPRDLWVQISIVGDESSIS